MADRTGQLPGNYHLLRLLGQEGFADVYLDEHVHINILVAIICQSPGTSSPIKSTDSRSHYTIFQ